MLEKIDKPGYESLSHPSTEAIEFLKKMKSEATEPLVAAEIGLGIGTTTVHFARILDESDELHLFDRIHVVNELVADLEGLPEPPTVKLVNQGNEANRYASYSWKLALWFRELRQAGKSGRVFDFVYLDGAHDFFHDAAATAVLKRMIKPGGYLVFDDMYWTFAASPTMNPKKRPETAVDYTPEQLSIPHVELVVDVLMRPDRGFEQVFLDPDNPRPMRAVFRKKTKAERSAKSSARRPVWRRAAGRVRSLAN